MKETSRGPGAVGTIPHAMRIIAFLVAIALPAAADLEFATGPTRSTAGTAGQRLAAVFSQDPLLPSIHERLNSSPITSLWSLSSGKGEIGIVPLDLLVDAREGKGEFGQPCPGLSLIAILYHEPIFIVAREDAGVSKVADLAGKRVMLGTEERGGARTAWTLLRAHGIGPSQVTTVRANAARAIDLFKTGDVQVMILFGTDLLSEAVATGGILVPVDREAVAKLVSTQPLFHLGEVAGQPTAMIDVALVAGAGVSKSVAHDLAEAVFTAAPRLTDEESEFEAISPRTTNERSPVPIHPGALVYIEEAGAIPYPVQVYIGVYAYSISELDLAKGTFLFDGYIWFRWKGRLPDDDGGAFDFALVNGTIESIDSGSRVIHRDGWNRQSRRFTAKLRGNFVLHDYPFDHQRLDLVVEHRWQGTEKLVFVPDDGAATSGSLKASFLADTVAIGDWRIRDARHRAIAKKYETDFGSIAKDEWQGASSRYIFTVEIERSITRYALKLLLPLVVAVAMGFIVFWIDVKHFDAKSCLGILAILNCIGLHVVHADNLPEVGYLVKADWFFILAYVLLSLCLVVVVWESNLHLAGRHDAVRRLARISRWAFPLAFAGPIVAIFLTA